MYSYSGRLIGTVQVFERVLYIWAIRHPASGYVQGINDLVTPFFVVFLSEYLADGQLVQLWCLFWHGTKCRAVLGLGVCLQ